MTNAMVTAMMLLMGLTPDQISESEARATAEEPTREELVGFKVGDRVRPDYDDYEGSATIEKIDLDAESEQRVVVNEAEAGGVRDLVVGLPLGPFWGHLKLALVEPATTSTGAVETHG